MSVWDDPEIRSGGDYIKFDKPGDAVAGTIQAVRKHRFEDGKVAPEVLLVTDQGEEKTVSAGQVRLKAELAQQRPEAGDHITITLTQIEPRAGGKELKHFSVQIRRGNGQVPPAPAPQGPQGFGQYTPPAQQQQQYAPPAPPPQQYGAPQVPPGYQAPPVPQYAPQPPPAPPAPAAAPPQQYAAPAPQQYAPPAAPQPPAPPAAPAGAPALSPEQQAAIAALTPEAKAALGWA